MKVKELVKTSPLGAEDKELCIDAETLQFQDKFILRKDITGIRYWISAIEVDTFAIGRKFHIGLKSSNHQIDIILRSYFGFGNAYFSTLCDRILNEIWNQAIERIWEKETAALLAGETIGFGHCQMNSEGIYITKDNLVTKQKAYISWADLQYEKKYDKLVLSNKNNHTTWTNLYFKDTWNIEILFALLDWVTKESGLAETQNQ